MNYCIYALLDTIIFYGTSLHVMQFRNLTIAGISLMMIAGLIAPGMQSTNASGIPRTPDDTCLAATGGLLPNGVGIVGLDTVLVKCFDAADPCFAVGVPVAATVPTPCTFGVVGANSFGDTLIVQDALPAEWQFVFGEEIDQSVCNSVSANAGTPDKHGKKAGRSATLIECVGLQGTFVGFTVLVETRESPSTVNKEEDKFKPTSCRTFEINEGAVMLLGDVNGDPVLEEVQVGVFEPIVLAEIGPLSVPVTGEDCNGPI